MPVKVFATPPAPPPAGSAREVGLAFLKLGLTSFGGPIAHLGYFHREFVQRRRWLDDDHYAQLLGLCQFLPGPASSQLGFSLGLLRAGWAGAIAAFIGFTLPSALLLFAFAALSSHLSNPIGQAAIHGLKLVAVAVVAQGLWSMARALTPDKPRVAIAIAAAGLLIAFSNAWMPLLVIAGGAVLGPWLCRHVAARGGGHFALRYGPRTGAALLLAFGLLLAISLSGASGMMPLARVTAAFYRAGALVFGGGHVVLPMLKQAVVDPGWISNDTFLTGYGAAQAVPGPLFTLAAFLGDRLQNSPGGALGAMVSLLAIFLPGLLLVSGMLPFWQTLAARDDAARLLAGIHATVVGLLASALYNPVWIGAIHRPLDVAIALIAFVLLLVARWPAWAVLGCCVLASVSLTAWH
nr:chromate efflux transporter [Dyella silvatica]